MADAILHVDDVRKSYGRHVALAGVSLTVGRGELFGFLGPNGAGKSTLLSIITGLTDADAGGVALAGERFTPADRRRRSLVGLGTQDLAVYPDLTGRENLLFFGRLYGMTGSDLAHRSRDVLAAVGLADRADHRAGTFSGGMKRRLNLAVAVIHRPKVLLLDEPTTGVDPQSRNLIFDMVRRLNADGMTVVYTSHYMEEVQSLCPRVAIIDRGKVLACSSREELLRTLDATLRLEMPRVPDGMAKLPSVKSLTPIPGGVKLTVDAVAPALAAATEFCLAAGVRPTAITISEPTLENVFLHLTGRELRD